MILIAPQSLAGYEWKFHVFDLGGPCNLRTALFAFQATAVLMECKPLPRISPAKFFDERHSMGRPGFPQTNHNLAFQYLTLRVSAQAVGLPAIMSRSFAACRVF
jgi:hypothetical protein